MQVARKKNFQKMHAEEPGTEEAVDGVKYGPCKFDLAEAWRDGQARKSQPGNQSPQKRVQ